MEECLNCIRVLTRLLPLLLGPQTDNRVRDRIEEQVLWKKERRVTNKKKKKEENNNSQESGDDGQFVIEDEDDDEEEEQQGQETTTPKPQTSSSTEEEEEFEEVLPCLAEKLIATLTKLLFVPGLTLPSSVDSNSESSTNNFIVNYSIWYVVPLFFVHTLIVLPPCPHKLILNLSFVGNRVLLPPDVQLLHLHLQPLPFYSRTVLKF